MKVKSKFNITKGFIAGLDVMVDKAYTTENRKYWQSNLAYVKSVMNLDMSEIKPRQRAHLTNIAQTLRKNGFSK